jgi:hypothetical protein
MRLQMDVLSAEYRVHSQNATNLALTAYGSAMVAGQDMISYTSYKDSRRYWSESMMKNVRNSFFLSALSTSSCGFVKKTSEDVD